ncbi:DUF350 domain-containing protein [Candidatus Micrarchaeota archaeon]|nr:DUF350 domain-containing protein [Candidatus Micrarchaeota archaeon]MBU1166529.1 DUF350 domain-containing protein [Candidatus Micrarchaeota archaeon]MBU1887541.1 DUF350 domain-containing protein [Candidatus Micrarchaeota archaeon]
MIVQIIMALVQIFIAIVLSAGALYTGISMLDRLTPNIDEWKEIKKGNLAVGVFYTAVMVSLIILVAPSISDLLGYLVMPLQVVALLLSFLNYIITLIIGIVVIYFSIHVVDKLTYDLDEMEQLKKGNVAIALIMSAAVLAITYTVTFPLLYLLTLLKSVF